MDPRFLKIISDKLTVAKLQQMKNNLEPHLPTNKNENKKIHDQYELIIQIIKYMNEYCDTHRLSLLSDDETSNNSQESNIVDHYPSPTTLKKINNIIHNSLSPNDLAEDGDSIIILIEDSTNTYKTKSYKIPKAFLTSYFTENRNKISIIRPPRNTDCTTIPINPVVKYIPNVTRIPLEDDEELMKIEILSNFCDNDSNELRLKPDLDSDNDINDN